MIIRRVENLFADEFQAGRYQFLGSDSEFFVWYGDDLSVDVFFTVLVTSAPSIDVILFNTRKNSGNLGLSGLSIGRAHETRNQIIP